MQIFKAYKLRLYPNKEQEQKLFQTLGACRFVWNYYLNKRKEEYLQSKKTFSYYDCAKDLTKLKKQKDFEWLEKTQSAILQQSLRNLEAAYQKFFKKQGNFPKFKSRKAVKQSFRKPQSWKIEGNKIQIEQNLLVRARGTFPPQEANLKSITISYENNGKWFCSIKSEESIKIKVKKGKPVGIDLGLNHLAITSNGKKYNNLKPRKLLQKTIKKLSQDLFRKQKGSNNRQRAKVALARLHLKIKNQRTNHLHQVSHRITSENQALIVCEDLSVKNMQANHSLAGSIADTGWGEFARQIEYKQKWRGGEFKKIDRFFPSSKTCSNCWFILHNLPLSIREWKCPQCGISHDRDINAAKVILQQGLSNSPARRAQRVARLSGRVRVTGSLKR